MASFSFDQAQAEAMLKEMYDVPAMQNLAYKDRPLFALLTKRGGEGGQSARIPLQINNSQGFAPTIAQAQAVAAALDIEAFSVPNVPLFSVARLAGQTKVSAMTSKQAFAEATKVVMDGAINRLANGLASGIYRDGSGVIGTITATGSTLASGIVQLSNPSDIVQFERDQALQALDPSSGAIQGGTYYVISVNRDAGSLVVSASLGGAAADVSAVWAAADNLISAGTKDQQVDGLQAWLPGTAPTSTDSFFGVNRSKDVVRLAGVRFNGSALSVKDAIVGAMLRVAREGGTPTHVFMNFESYASLIQDLQSNVVYTDLVGATADVSFTAVKFMGPRGAVTVVPDRFCPAQTAYVLQLDTWFLLHANEGDPIFLETVTKDQYWRVLDSEDAYEVRAKAYCNLAGNAPGFSAVVSLSA